MEIIEIEAWSVNYWLCIQFFAMKEKDKEPIIFYITCGTLPRKNNKLMVLLLF
jgi:hypothetical protein